MLSECNDKLRVKKWHTDGRTVRTLEWINSGKEFKYTNKILDDASKDGQVDVLEW